MFWTLLQRLLSTLLLTRTANFFQLNQVFKFKKLKLLSNPIKIPLLSLKGHKSTFLLWAINMIKIYFFIGKFSVKRESPTLLSQCLYLLVLTLGI